MSARVLIKAMAMAMDAGEPMHRRSKDTCG